MTDIQCDHPGCTISAKEKCGTCGNIFCVRHIQLIGVIYICDLCIARAIAEKEEEAARERAAQARAAARREAEKAETLARLEAERPKREAKREANRKQRVKLAWIGTSMILSGILLTFIFMSITGPEQGLVRF